MLPYGFTLTYQHRLEAPDLADIHKLALKSSTGAIRGKSGIFRRLTRNRDNFRATRRYWNKCHRLTVKRELLLLLGATLHGTRY